MGKGRDQVDQLCEQWARTRRELLGLSLPSTSRGQIGALRCTLAARRDLHAGSRSIGRVDQHWPEVYVGDAALVNAVFKRLREPLQEILDAHYVVLQPRSKSMRADLMGLSVRVYWDRLNRAKASIEGALAIVETVRTLPAPNGAISRTRLSPSA